MHCGVRSVYVYQEGVFEWRFSPAVQAYAAYHQVGRQLCNQHAHNGPLWCQTGTASQPQHSTVFRSSPYNARCSAGGILQQLCSQGTLVESNTPVYSYRDRQPVKPDCACLSYPADLQGEVPPEPEPFNPGQPDIGGGVAELQQLGLLQLLLQQHSLH